MYKFAKEDQAYFDNRDRLAAKYHDANLWFVADNWPLFAGAVNIARCLAIYDLVKRVVDLPGHFCELGCWNGTNLAYLAKIVNTLKPQSYTEVIGFDSFQGLQIFDAQKDSTAEELMDRYKGNVELLEDMLHLYNLEGFVRLIKGNIEETLPRFLREREDIRFAFVYVDVDLYSATKVGVELLWPRLLTGGVMVFDEYNIGPLARLPRKSDVTPTHNAGDISYFPGETIAIHDVLGNDVQIHSVPFTRQPTAYVIKE